jgi:flagellar basal-body rod modification protein FlgD
MDATSATTTATSIQMDYMKLLIAQLQNQNPLEPLDNNEMASQLAQFSQLQQLESMNSSFSKVLDAVEHAYATSLIGKNVSFLVEGEDGAAHVQTGAVEQVFNDTDGQIYLVIGDFAVGLEEVVSVRN